MKKIPVLIERKRPLPTEGSYAINYLFVNYILQQWGGWPTINAMAKHGFNTGGYGSQTLEKMTYRARYSLAKRNYPQFMTERMNAKDLLRYFAVALVLGPNKHPLYSIRNWMGFQNQLQITTGHSFEPGEFQAVSPSALGPMNQNLEAYRLMFDEDDFKISSISETSRARFKKDVVLIINTSLTEEINLNE